MVQTPEKPQEDDGGSQFDLGALTKFGAASAALAYATGTFAINTYLHQLGITDFSLAKPKLILTGILVLLTFLLLALLPVFVMWRRTGSSGLEGRTLPPSKKIAFWLLFPLLVLIAASAALCFGKPGLGQITVWGVWELTDQHTWLTETLASLTIAAEVYLPVWVAVVSAFAALRLFDRAKPEAGTSRVPPEKVYFPFVTALALVSIIGYIYVFSLTFYPAIPSAFGGGKPYFESFVITEERRCQLQQLGIPFPDEQLHPNVTSFLPVLHESDSLVAVWLERLKIPSESESKGADDSHSRRQVVVQLDKSQISATVADPRETDRPKLAPPQVACKPSSSSVAVPKNP